MTNFYEIDEHYEAAYEEAAYQADLEMHERRYETEYVPHDEMQHNAVSPQVMVKALIQHQHATSKIDCTFAQIQEGDFVERTENFADGSSVTYQGIATHRRTVIDPVYYYETVQWMSNRLMVADMEDDMQDSIILQRIPRSEVLYS